MRPAYYALGSGDPSRSGPGSRLGGSLSSRVGGWRDWWTLLHPPYTGWHLSYSVIGAALAPRVQVSRLVATVLAFFLAVGLAAHALDELRGRPLRTSIPSRVLWAVVSLGLSGALTLGILGGLRVGWVLVPFMVLGPALVIGYNAELFGGFMHTDVGFAASWGSFPVLVGYAAQDGSFWSVRVIAVLLAAAAALALSLAQRRLSTPARDIRRRVSDVSGAVTYADGRVVALSPEVLLRPLERSLRTGSWAIMLLAASLAVARLA